MTKADAVYAALRARIESGALTPGTVLSENTVVAEHGASRTPVREALRRLEGDGLLERGGERGALQVTQVSVAGVHDLFGLREVLESAAFAQLADAVGAGRADAARRDLGELRDAFAALDPDAPDPAVFYDLTDRFDGLVAARTPNPLLGAAVAEQRPHSARLRAIAHVRPGRAALSLAEHRSMLDALLAGDPPAAADACRAHLRATKDAIFAGLAEGRTPGVLTL